MDYLMSLMLIISASCVCMYLYGQARQRSHKHKLPPGPSPLPVVGNLFQLGCKPNESLAELAKTYGPLMTLRLGHTLVVVVSSAVMAKEVFQKNDQALSGRPVGDAVRVFDYNKLTIGWSPADSHWRKLRSLCNTHIFAVQKLNANQGLRHWKVQELIAYIRKSCVEGQAVNIGQAAFVTSLNLLSNTILSADFIDIYSACSVQELRDTVHGMMGEAARPNPADYFPMLRLIDPKGVRRCMIAHFNKFYAILDKFIDERLQSRASPNALRRNDFLDVLLDHSQENDSEITYLHIRPLFMELIMAGTDTTSVTIEWIMAELLCNPKVLSRARSEMKDIIGLERKVEESDITHLPYLQAIIKETLRLHPTAPLLIPHKAEASVDIGGYTVPKNTRVIVNAWAIGRDPKIWEDPTSFQPERFMGSDVDVKGHDFDLIPFGSGRRICPGMPLALRTVHLLLASLLHSFDWKLPDGVTPMDVNMDYKLGMNMQMAVPLLAVPLQQ